jgi:hypothetical protein
MDWLQKIASNHIGFIQLPSVEYLKFNSSVLVIGICMRVFYIFDQD